MSNPLDSIDDHSTLDLETLDRWESELDQFTAQIMQRLSNLGGGDGVTESGNAPDSLRQFLETDSDVSEDEEEDDAMKIWRAVQDLNQ